MTETLTVELPETLIEKLDILAAEVDMPVQWVIEQALGAYAHDDDPQFRRTLAGIAAGDAGRVVSHEAMAAWGRSLSTGRPLPVPRYAG